MSLYDRPDPRRLDLRASLRSLTGEWLVRVNRQRAGLSVHAVVDVSASMSFGAAPKLQAVADFLESLGVSAFRTGDALGMLAFDSTERADLFIPPRIGRGVGSVMAARIRQVQTAAAAAAAAVNGVDAGARGMSGGRGLEQALLRLAGREGLVFIVSDFHWPLDRLGAVLDLLAHASVVPLIFWDRAEIEPPAQNGFALLRDTETGAPRTLWLRPKLRNLWREAVARRRAELDSLFASKFVRPVYFDSEFDAEVLSKYFFEAGP